MAAKKAAAKPAKKATAKKASSKPAKKTAAKKTESEEEFSPVTAADAAEARAGKVGKDSTSADRAEHQALPAGHALSSVPSSALNPAFHNPPE